MPPPDDPARLRHILEAARKAVRFSGGKSREDMVADEMLFLALTRLLEMIGEAAAGVTDEFKARHSEIPWRKMSGMRNRLIHGYFDINHKLVWETVIIDLPAVIKQVQAVIEEETL